MRANFTDIKVGDRVIRLLSGVIPMELTVTDIDEQFIYCGAPGEGWKFDRTYGYEVDEELGWGVPGPEGKIMTGSYLYPGEAASSGEISA